MAGQSSGQHGSHHHPRGHGQCCARQHDDLCALEERAHFHDVWRLHEQPNDHERQLDGGSRDVAEHHV